MNSHKTKSKKYSPNKVSVLVRDIFFLMIGTIVTIIIVQIIVGKLMILMIGREAFVETVPTAIFSALTYVIAMVILIWLPPKLKSAWSSFKKRKNKRAKIKETPKVMSREKLGLKDLPTWLDIGLAPAGFILYLVLAAALMAVFSIFPWFDFEQTQNIGFDIYLTGVDRMIAFVVLVVIAPIAEEIIFRGWLYTKVKDKISKETTRKASIVITALIVSLTFGIVHLQWNVGVNVFAMSLVACAMREFTGTIYAGILLHMLKNGVAFYLLFVMGIT